MSTMYRHTKHSPLFSQRGQIIADKAGHALISASYPRAYQLGDAAAKAKTLDALRAELKERGFYFELVYDAAHGRRYVMFVFMPSAASDYATRTKENQGARRLAFDFQCAPESSYYESPAA